MSFEPLEASRHSGQPITLMRFTYGPTTAPSSGVYAYTDADQPVTFQDTVYRPVPLDRGAIVSSGTLDRAALEIRMPQDLEVPNLFRFFPPSQVVTLTIFQGHANDGALDFRAIWTGRIINCALEGNEARLTGEPVATSLRRPGLRRNYQRLCPHALYGRQCRASKAAATTLTVAQAVASASITLPSAWETPERAVKALGGVVEWQATDGTLQFRAILKVDALTILSLSGPTTGLQPGGAVSVSLGCNHQDSDCRDIHNNIVNFGGQRWIPTKNPIGASNNFF